MKSSTTAVHVFRYLYFSFFFRSAHFPTLTAGPRSLGRREGALATFLSFDTCAAIRYEIRKVVRTGNLS